MLPGRPRITRPPGPLFAIRRHFFSPRPTRVAHPPIGRAAPGLVTRPSGCHGQLACPCLAGRHGRASRPWHPPSCLRPTRPRGPCPWPSRGRWLAGLSKCRLARPRGQDDFDENTAFRPNSPSSSATRREKFTHPRWPPRRGAYTGRMKLPPPPTGLARVLGPWTAVAVVVGTVIGSGVFKKPQAVADAVPYFGIAALVWVLG